MACLGCALCSVASSEACLGISTVLEPPAAPRALRSPESGWLELQLEFVVHGPWSLPLPCVLCWLLMFNNNAKVMRIKRDGPR
jgi:hypothetical protein